jgi:hypothetical protein
MFELTVRVPFASYQKGDFITDAAKIKEILASEHAHHVVKVPAGVHAAAPAAAPAAEAAPADEH